MSQITGVPQRLLLVLSLVLAGGVLSATPVLAEGISAGSAAFRPDGWVRYHSYHYHHGKLVDPSEWTGDDVYNSTGKHQTAKQRHIAAEPLTGNYDVFQMTIQNDGPTDQFRVSALGTGDWVVKYFRGTTNITPKIVGGSYLTRSLGPGESVVIKVKVWIGDADTSIVRLLTIKSVGDPSRADTVRIKASMEGCGC